MCGGQHRAEVAAGTSVSVPVSAGKEILQGSSSFTLPCQPDRPWTQFNILTYCTIDLSLTLRSVLLPSSMPDTPILSATERSPLLGKVREQAPFSTAEGNGLGQNGPANDIESNERTEDVQDSDLSQARKKVKSLLPILGIGIFLALLDQSIVAAINGEIGSELHALSNVSWIATAYFLTMTASQPLYGKLSDVFGRKPCLLFAYTMFGLGSLGCGLTRSMEGLIAARVGQNLGLRCDVGTEGFRQFRELVEAAY